MDSFHYYDSVVIFCVWQSHLNTAHKIYRSFKTNHNLRHFQSHKSGEKKCASRFSYKFAFVFDRWYDPQMIRILYSYLLHFQAKGFVDTQHNYWRCHQWKMKTPKTQNRTAQFLIFFITKGLKTFMDFISKIVIHNCSTNYSLLQKLDSKTAEWYSHPFNLPVQYYVKKHATFVTNAQYIMTTLSNHIPGAKWKTKPLLKRKQIILQLGLDIYDA